MYIIFYKLQVRINETVLQDCLQSMNHSEIQLYQNNTWEDLLECWNNSTDEEIQCHNECIDVRYNHSLTCHPKLTELVSTWKNLTQYNETWLNEILSRYDVYLGAIENTPTPIFDFEDGNTQLCVKPNNCSERINATISQNEESCGGEWKYPSSCNPEEKSCFYFANWIYHQDTDMIDFTVQSKHYYQTPKDRWIGIGFSETSEMVQ